MKKCLRLHNNKIIYVHCFNNYSGSPRVLSEVIRCAVEQGAQVWLITSKGNGFLSNIPGVNYKYISYDFNRNKRILWFLNYIMMQVEISFKLFSLRNLGIRTVYFNTLVHFLPEFFSFFLFKRRIIHIHEISIKPLLLRKIYLFSSNHFCPNAIFVSKYLLEHKEFTNKQKYLVYNTVDRNILSLRNFKPDKRFVQNRITLISSLNYYKGIDILIKLAQRIYSYKFRLVINAHIDEVVKYFSLQTIPPNCELLINEIDPVKIFDDSSLVINLSIPDLCIEAFGLTILEAMNFGIPVIAPYVGGPAEIIENGKCGYLINPVNIDEVEKYIYDILQNEENYKKLSQNAHERAKLFSNEAFSSRIIDILCELDS